MAEHTSRLYDSYTIPNSVLKKELRLIRHPEGGQPSLTRPSRMYNDC